MRRNRLFALCGLMTLFLPLPASAAEMGMSHAHKCEGKELACASAASAAFATDGTLWLAWAAGGFVSAGRSSDEGRTVTPVATLNAEPLNLDAGVESRPKIAADGHGRIFITYPVFKDKAFNAQVFYSRSLDGGKTFSPPAPITDDPESQRFDTFAIAPDGKLFIAWLDKRNRAAAKAKGEKFKGAALAYAWASSPAAAPEAARLAHEPTCECCRIAAAFNAQGKPAVIFRNIFEGGIRDHAVVTFGAPHEPGPARRVSVDQWQTDACPHQGPSLSISKTGTYHVTWYTAGKERSGLFYASSSDEGAHFTEPMRIGDADRAASRAFVYALGQTVWLAWKEFDGERTHLMTRLSSDGGRTWGEPREAADTKGDAAPPFIIEGSHRLFISWLTHEDGYRLIPLGAGS